MRKWLVCWLSGWFSSSIMATYFGSQFIQGLERSLSINFGQSLLAQFVDLFVYFWVCADLPLNLIGTLRGAATGFGELGFVSGWWRGLLTTLRSAVWGNICSLIIHFYQVFSISFFYYFEYYLLPLLTSCLTVFTYKSISRFPYNELEWIYYLGGGGLHMVKFDFCVVLAKLKFLS